MEGGRNFRLIIASVCLACAVAIGAGKTSAMPALDHGLPTAQGMATEQVRWVCGPYRCFWRPNYWGYYRPYRPWGYYRPYRPWRYGFYRPYRRWGWGWRRRYW
jgi:hypothetical protein